MNGTSSKKERMLQHSVLTKHLIYDRITGQFTKRSNGRAVGSLDGDGYVKVACKGVSYIAHRLAWFYVYTRWPNGHVHHMNHVKTDNSWSNLQELPAGEHSKQHKATPRFGYGEYMSGSPADLRSRKVDE